MLKTMHLISDKFIAVKLGELPLLLFKKSGRMLRMEEKWMDIKERSVLKDGKMISHVITTE